MNNKMEVLNPKDKPVINPLDSTPGIRYPPKNNIEDNVDKNTIAPYSAKKKNTKGNAEYSKGVFIFKFYNLKDLNLSSNPIYKIGHYKYIK